MSAEAYLTPERMTRLGQLVGETSLQVSRVRLMFDRVCDQMSAAAGSDEGAEAGWRRFN